MRLGRYALAGFSVLALAYLIVPIIVVIAFSFNDPAGRFNYTWEQFTLDNWRNPFGVPGLQEAMVKSLQIAVLATIVSTILGTLVAMALVRHRFRGKSTTNLLIFLPMSTPEIVLGASLLTLFLNLGVATGFWTIVIAHVMFCVSFVVVTMKARFAGFDRALEEAAMDLGATPWRTFRRVTLPLIAPGILAAALLAFSLSIDDFVVTQFNAGTEVTFPLFVWGAARVGAPPQVNVIGSMIFLVRGRPDAGQRAHPAPPGVVPRGPAAAATGAGLRPRSSCSRTARASRARSCRTTARSRTCSWLPAWAATERRAPVRPAGDCRSMAYDRAHVTPDSSRRAPRGFGPAGRRRHVRRLQHPERLIVVSFAAVIAIGTALLMLPIATTGRDEPPFIDALFTSTSAVCVTGLTVVDTGTYWSDFGQAVILGLIQVGGLGIMTLTAFAIVVLRRRIGLRQRVLTKAGAAATDLGSARRLAKYVVAFTLLFEGVFAIVLSLRFWRTYDQSVGDAAWHGLFHTVSAFNNAGFGLQPDNLVRFNQDAIVSLGIAFLIISGGLGFPVWLELRDRRFRGFGSFSLHTKLMLVGSAALIAFGFVAFLALEWSNPATLGQFEASRKVLPAFFQAVTPRTAGFNSLDYSQMNEETWLTQMMLMFVGGGPASTAGGIKVTTFLVLLLAVAAEARGVPDATAFGRRIPVEAIRLSFVVAFIAVNAIVIGSLAILIDSSFGFTRVLLRVHLGVRHGRSLDRHHVRPARRVEVHPRRPDVPRADGALHAGAGPRAATAAGQVPLCGGAADHRLRRGIDGGTQAGAGDRARPLRHRPWPRRSPASTTRCSASMPTNARCSATPTS